MRRSAILLSLLLAGCASYKADYQARLIDTLPNKRGVVFEDEKSYPGKVLCGSYTARDYIGYKRTKPFVITPEVVLGDASEAEQAVYCSRESESQLFEVKGIGGSDSAWAELAEIAADMSAIESGVLAYYNDRNLPPRELPQLLEGAYGVDETQLADPWGRPYGYNPGIAGRSLPQIQLGTLGADGEPGGRENDADISNKELPLLRHVLALRGDS
jgi:hypothetical protein